MPKRGLAWYYFESPLDLRQLVAAVSMLIAAAMGPHETSLRKPLRESQIESVQDILNDKLPNYTLYTHSEYPTWLHRLLIAYCC